MTATRLAWLNFTRFARGLSGSTAAVMVGVLLVFLSSAFAESAASTIRTNLSQGAGLRQVDVHNHDDETSVKRLTARSIAEIERIPGVRSVEPVVQATLSTPEAVSPFFAVTAVSVRPNVLPPLVAASRERVFPLAPGEVVLPATHQAQDLRSLLGKKIDVQYVRQTGPSTGGMEDAVVTVVALFDPVYQVDGPEAAYASIEDVVTWASAGAGRAPDQFLDEFGYFQATVLAATAEDVPAVTERLQQAGFFALSVQDRIRELPGVIKMLQAVSQVLLVGLAIISLTAGAGVGASIARSRVRHIGVLKSLGYTSSHVRRSMTLELAALGLAAGAVATTGGMALAALFTWLVSRSGTLPDLLAVTSVGQPWLPVVTLLLPVVGLTLGGTRRVARAADTEPVVSLRSW